MKTHAKSIAVYLGLKMLVLPLVVIASAEVIGLDTDLREVAILIACLPIAMACFTLAKAYEVNTEIMAGCIVAGGFLMAPAVLFWDWLGCKITSCALAGV